MRVLVLGAGGIGGYFGARLHDAGGDITFMVRPARAENLRAHGLRVASPLGDTALVPQLIAEGDDAGGGFDVIMLSCKAYDLDAAVDDIAPMLHSGSVVLPLLNGLAHLDKLDARFGRARVLGGVAHVSVALGPAGQIRHLNKFQRLIFGSRGQEPSPWLAPLEQLMAASPVSFTVSEHIEQDMWEKFVFLATLAGATCTMRANVGEILSTCAGESFITGLLGECEQIAAASGYPASPEKLAVYREQLNDRGSTVAASMLRDIGRDGPTEADHILGDLVARGDRLGIEVPLLKLAYSHLQAYELVRQRRQADKDGAT
ncbi:MAG: ketopantoate reductase family protein [Burkholderiaceae bacterium]|nr:ketopantoate reductase family protein [Burkholderiaceae bacterium]